MNEPAPLGDRPDPVDTSTDPEDMRARAEESREHEARLACLQRCIANLPAISLELIKQYYSEGEVLNKEQRKQIAERFGLSAVALRSRAFRIRGDLERCVSNCLEAAVADRNSSHFSTFSTRAQNKAKGKVEE